MMRWLKRRSERDPVSCVCDYQLMHIFHAYTLDDTMRVCVSVSVGVLGVCTVSILLSRSLSNTNAAEEVEETSLPCIEIGMYMIQ